LERATKFKGDSREEKIAFSQKNFAVKFAEPDAAAAS
jgi:hypothetical protein